MDILYLNGKPKERITSMKKKSMLIIVLILTFVVSIFMFNKNHELVDKESLAVFIDNVKTDSFPSKGTVTFLKADCDNNATIEWVKILGDYLLLQKHIFHKLNFLLHNDYF